MRMKVLVAQGIEVEQCQVSEACAAGELTVYRGRRLCAEHALVAAARDATEPGMGVRDLIEIRDQLHGAIIGLDVRFEALGLKPPVGVSATEAFEALEALYRRAVLRPVSSTSPEALEAARVLARAGRLG